MAPPVKSYSSGQAMPMADKVREAAALSRMAWKSRNSAFDLRWFDEYRALLQQHGGIEISSASAIEFGYGARPDRMLALLALGVDVYGIDRDTPVGHGGLRTLPRVARENGLTRATKSLAREALAGRSHRSAVSTAVAERGGRVSWPGSRFIVGDLVDPALPDRINRRFDFAFSEDVLEHVPAAGLPTLMSNLNKLLRPGGLALLRPNVFTGITGGHLTEWFPDKVDDNKQKRSEPWEHLRKRRFVANTHLNEVTRRDYRSLFREQFEILSEEAEDADLGRSFLTPEVRAELHAFHDDELFSNRVLWVLRRP
jgi:SAM-dependent methyltransferase